MRMAQRQSALWGDGLGELGKGQPGTARVGAFGGKVRAPGGHCSACMMQGREHGFLPQCVPKAAIVAFGKCMSRVSFPGAISCQSALRSPAKASIAFDVNLVPLSLTTVASLSQVLNRVAG